MGRRVGTRDDRWYSGAKPTSTGHQDPTDLNGEWKVLSTLDVGKIRVSVEHPQRVPDTEPRPKSDVDLLWVPLPYLEIQWSNYLFLNWTGSSPNPAHRPRGNTRQDRHVGTTP